MSIDYYRERYIVEGSASWLTQDHHISMRHEEVTASYLGFGWFAALADGGAICLPMSTDPNRLLTNAVG